MTPKLNEQQIRVALVHWLYQHKPSCHVFNDVDLINDNVQIDVLRFFNNYICGFEIKSDIDSLARLPHQVRAYPTLTDGNYLVVSEHLYDQAVALLDNDWGIIKATPVNDAIQLEVVRFAQVNATDSFPELLAQIPLPMLREEIPLLLNTRGYLGYRRMAKKAIERDLSDGTLMSSIPKRTLHTYYRKFLLQYLLTTKPNLYK